MILEVAILNIIPGLEDAFLEAFSVAQGIISKMAGYISHQLKRCIEDTSRFVLLVEWKVSEDQKNTRNGKRCYIIFITHFQQLNIMNR
jgi:heme-degrading monooxygenase HmoA